MMTVCMPCLAFFGLGLEWLGRKQCLHTFDFDIFTLSFTQF